MPINKLAEFTKELETIGSTMYPGDQQSIAAFMHGGRVAADIILQFYELYDIKLDVVGENRLES